MEKITKTAVWLKKSDTYNHSSYFCSRCGTQEGEPHDECPNCKAQIIDIIPCDD